MNPAVTGTKNMTATPVDDAPTATNLNAGETYTEDTPLNLTDIVVSDVDSANVTVTLTLSDVAAGSLSTATSGSVTSTFVGGVWTASGAIADVNALLSGVTFNPASNYDSNFTIATSVDDGVNPAVTGSKNMTATPVDDAPTATNLSAGETYTEDTPLNLTDIVVSDVDSANVTVTLTLSDVAAGTLSTATFGSVTSTFAGGVWTASGAIADVNTLLAGVTFNPAANYNSNFTIATSVDDGVNPAVTGTKNMTATPVNDGPTATNLNAGETYIQNTLLNLTDIVVSDVDSANVTVTLTLSDVAAGTLSTATSGSVTSTFAGGVWTASGAIADVNILLAGVTFNPALNYSNNFTIATSVDDGVAPPVTGTKSLMTTNAVPTTTGIANFTVNEDAPATTTNLFAAFDDSEDPDPALTYTITGNTNATLFSSTPIDGAAGTLTLNYAANANGTADITLRATDTAGSFVESTFTVTVSAVNDDPSLSANTNLSLNQGGSSAVTSSVLSVTDLDNSAAQISYTLTNIPIGGTLFLNGAPLGSGDSFTQDDINNNRVTYSHGGGAASSDSFSFTVSDGAGGTLGPITFSVTVVPGGSGPPGTGGGTIDPPAPPPITTDPPPPAGDPAPTGATDPSGGGNPTPLTFGGPSLSGETQKPRISHYDPIGLPERTESSTTLDEENQPTTQENQFTGLAEDLTAFDEPAESTDAHPEGDSIWTSLDNTGSEMRDIAELQGMHREIIVNVSRGIGLSLTVGYISWLISSGTLLASALASMPMWTKFDPLPILAGKKKRRKRKDGATTREQSEMSDNEKEVDALFDDSKSKKRGRGDKR